MALIAVFAAGSAVTLARVEDDLGRRVARALDDSGLDGISVSFSGQDGTLACDVALDDPEAARRVGESVNGVRQIGLEASCLGGQETTQGEQQSEPPPTATTSTAPTTAPPATTTSSGPTTTLPVPATVLDIVLADPQFAVFKNALEAVDLGGVLGGGGPVTVFAPTDEAFAALGPNFNAALASDPETLGVVLAHHIVTESLSSADLSDGPLVMLDDSTVEIDTTSGVRLISGDTSATVVDSDVDAVNGTVHVIDQVLIPAGIDLGVPADEISLSARYEGGTVVLSGDVAGDGQRARLLTAAQGVLAEANVVDQLAIDADAPIADNDIDVVVALVGTLSRHLVSGEVAIAAEGVIVSGVYVDAAALAAIEAATEGIVAGTELVERTAATEDEAVELEQRLNGVILAEPLRFDPARVELPAAAPAVLDLVAALAKSFGGLTITIEGHTDSDGSAAANVALSQGRADTVLEALVARGVPRADLLAIGLGSSQPVLVDGVEDKDASRRVQFAVERK